ncbi:SycD/LcrH family type III secretion system chaperone [Motilimonas pumila]|uniref:CesD/SycD/LcrH family type III secretion system chaperone n=1 Tax=Motilimonas pumila TaxID=2303987 RepID=A0A418YE39_9GAMM|nr:SycD/LcrH family type III secretion system chaperone [Motilimonas pumila]RJG42768.1 CesD/SycD/LcrH family type III secretion system chaperone [Motilimonas pumila]
MSEQLNPALIDNEQMKAFIDKGGVIHELLDVTDDELDSIYMVAYNLYQSCRYDDAEKLFQLLVTYNHYNISYYLGLGGCRQAKEKYQEAADTYSIAVLFDADDPRLPFHAGECHLALNDLKSAESGFYAAAMRAGEIPEYQELKAKAEGLLKLVQTKQADQEASNEHK